MCGSIREYTGRAWVVTGGCLGRGGSGADCEGNQEREGGETAHLRLLTGENLASGVIYAGVRWKNQDMARRLQVDSRELRVLFDINIGSYTYICGNPYIESYCQ